MSRVYRAALMLLPARMRTRHGAAMLETYGYMMERAGRSRRAQIRVLMGAVLDVVKRAPVEHGRRRYLPPQRRESGMSSFWSELRQAMKGALRQPGLTALVVLMLALGVAASTTVFTLANTLFWRSLPFEDADRLVYVNMRAPKWDLEFVGINYPDFVAWQDNVTAFESMAIYDEAKYNVALGDTPERLPAMQVTWRYGEVLKLRPVMGRWFTAEEDKPGAPRVVIIGEDLWRTRFNASRDILGRTLRMESEAYTIVGVAPRSAEFPTSASIWVPMRGDPLQQYESYGGQAFARMKPGVTLEAARADMLKAHTPVYIKNKDTERVVSPRVDDLREHYVGKLRTLARVMAGGVAIVLLVACANVMSLMLARATSRRREIAVRMALGADASRITVQLFAETAVLSLAGGTIGLVLAVWATSLLTRSIPEGVPPWLSFGLDARVVLFVGVVCALAATLAGLAPVLQAVRARPGAALTAEAGRRTTATRGQRRILNVLVMGEIALACMLLVSGGLLLKAFHQVSRVEPGFVADNALEFRLSLPQAKYAMGAPWERFYEDLLDRLRALPDVEHAGATSCPPLTCHWGMFYEAEGAPPRGKDDANPVVLTRVASTDFDRAIGNTMLRGRFFDDRDGRTAGTRAVIINEMLAKQLWPGQDALGKRLRAAGGDDSIPWSKVVGIERDIKHYGLDQPARPAIYVPLAQQPIPSLGVVLRTRNDPADLVAAVRSVVHGMDAELPMYDVKTVSSALSESLAMRRTYSWMLAVFATIALILSIGGIYGVLSYVVSQRTQEIGIRMALGARRAQVLSLVLEQGAALAVIGTIFGLLAAMGTGRWIESLLLAGSSPRDPATFIGAAVVLIGSALLAASVPAWRAVRVEPQAVLRDS